MSRILVVDDDVSVRAMLRQALESAGYDVAEASDGRPVGRIQQENPVDLVITDLVMPEKEGLELIRELRRDSPKTRIIAISGGGRGSAADYLSIASKLGADVALQKPVSLKTLLAEVERLTELRD